jgi:hypothetical protein
MPDHPRHVGTEHRRRQGGVGDDPGARRGPGDTPWHGGPAVSVVRALAVFQGPLPVDLSLVRQRADASAAVSGVPMPPRGAQDRAGIVHAPIAHLPGIAVPDCEAGRAAAVWQSGCRSSLYLALPRSWESASHSLHGRQVNWQRNQSRAEELDTGSPVHLALEHF